MICDDILTDFSEATLGQVPWATRLVLTTLLALRARGAVNRLTARAIRDSRSLNGDCVRECTRPARAPHTTGTGTAYDFLRGTARYETRSASGRVAQGVLLLAGSHPLPPTRPARLTSSVLRISHPNPKRQPRKDHDD
jgi:hypothetical protein